MDVCLLWVLCVVR